MVDQVDCHRFNAVLPDQVRGLSLELRQLQNRDVGPIVHYSKYTAVRHKPCAASWTGRYRFTLRLDPPTRRDARLSRDDQQGPTVSLPGGLLVSILSSVVKWASISGSSLRQSTAARFWPEAAAANSRQQASHLIGVYSHASCGASYPLCAPTYVTRGSRAGGFRAAR